MINISFESPYTAGSVIAFYKFTVDEAVPCVGLDGVAVDYGRFPVGNVTVVRLLFCDNKDSAQTAADSYIVTASHRQPVHSRG